MCCPILSGFYSHTHSLTCAHCSASSSIDFGAVTAASNTHPIRKMSPPPNSLTMRSSHPALAMWWEETRRTEARQDVRSELFALNMVLKAYGPPRATFGALPGLPVGMVVLRRMELCVLGLHRHFLSECSVTLQVRYQRHLAGSPSR